MKASDGNFRDSSWTTAFCALVAILTIVNSVLIGTRVYWEEFTKRGSGKLVTSPVLGNIVFLESRYGTFSREMPWNIRGITFQEGLEGANGAGASGLILEEGLIVTAAYIALDSMMITGTRQGNDTRFQLEVVAVAPELDLALLRPKESGFFKSSDITIDLEDDNELPDLFTNVLVAGLPEPDASVAVFGTNIAKFYASADGPPQRYSTLATITMSLYPEIGNSFSVGPVFSRAERPSLIGFLSKRGTVVPASTIAMFVKHVRQHASWSGIGTLGALMRPMLPPAMRKYWGLPDDDLGVQVRTVAPGSPLAAEGVKKGDILVAVDDVPVHSSGVVAYNSGAENRGIWLPFETLLSRKPPGTSSRFTLLRPELRGSRYALSQRLEVEVTLSKLKPFASQADGFNASRPSYVMIGGIVFSVFSKELFNQNVKTKDLMIPDATLAHIVSRWRREDDEEVVVMLRRMEHSCNQHYDGGSVVRVVKLFNDRPVKSLKGLVTMVGEALRQKSNYLQFVFYPLDDDDAAGSVGDPDIVLSSRLCAGADIELGLMLGIPDPVSVDLKETYVQSVPQDFLVLREGGTVMATSELVDWSVVPTTRESATQKPVESDVEVDLPWSNVVQIHFFSAKRNFILPWKVGGESRAGCSGIVVDVKARRILTNSHCVGSATAVYILRQEQPALVAARVVELAHDVDIAWITTDVDAFWQSDSLWPTVPMSTGLPALSSAVRVVGYPMGGASVTITQGIVSRVDGQWYPNGLVPGMRNTPDRLLIVQVDAAINHGNSGGPVFDSQGKLMGLAFAGIDGAQSVGYVIPHIYLKNFVDAVTQRGRWRAQPESGFRCRRIENLGLREFLRLQSNQFGVQVRTVSPFSSLRDVLKKGDILLSIDGKPIQGDGRVIQMVHGNEVLLPFDTEVTTKALNTTTRLEVLRVNHRTGKRVKFEVHASFDPIPPMAARFDDSPILQKGREFFAAIPSFFISYGLVFGVFSNPYMRQSGGKVPWFYVNMPRLLETFNGQPVLNLADLALKVLAAEGAHEEEFRFVFEPMADEEVAGNSTDPDVVLSSSMCARETQYLRKLGVPSRMSRDIAEKLDSMARNTHNSPPGRRSQRGMSSLLQANSEERRDRELVELEGAPLPSLSFMSPRSMDPVDDGNNRVEGSVFEPTHLSVERRAALTRYSGARDKLSEVR